MGSGEWAPYADNPDIARHAIGCHSTQQKMVQIISCEMADTVCQARGPSQPRARPNQPYTTHAHAHHLSPAQFNRAPHSSDGGIEAAWEAKLATRPRLWDAAKFRLAGVRVNNPGTGPAVTLQLGLTSYTVGPLAA